MGRNRTGVFSMKNRTKYAKTVLVGMSEDGASYLQFAYKVGAYKGKDA